MNYSMMPEKCKRCGRSTSPRLDFCEYCGAPENEQRTPKKYIDSITDVSAESLINAVEDEYGVAYSRDGERLVRCRNGNLRQYIVKAGTKVICDRAFRDGAEKSTYLRTIELPDSVTAIGETAFKYCKSLTSIKIPNSVTAIGAEAFKYCESLTTIELPKGLTAIGGFAFYGCDSLEKVYIRCSAAADEAAVIEKFKKLLPEALHDKIEIVRK